MKTIVQTLKFKAAPKVLYELYMDSKKHGLATGGAKAVISRKVGGSFSAHDGYIRGKTLLLVPGQTIVQTWRGGDWSKQDRDSQFILSFEPEGSGTVLTMVHANVPDNQAEHLAKGWHDFYWKPWKKYLGEK